MGKMKDEIAELIAICKDEIEANKIDQTTMAWHDKETPQLMLEALEGQAWYATTLANRIGEKQ